MPIPMFDAVLINGSVGTGKTTTAERLGNELKQFDVPGAVIDVDWLRRSWPSPSNDRFRTALARENLHAIASNFREAGAEVLIVADVIETPEDLRRSAVALASESLLHVRLTAAEDAVLSRLTKRHWGDDAAFEWHVRRSAELVRVLGEADFADELLVDTTERSVADVVQEILAALIR